MITGCLSPREIALYQSHCLAGAASMSDPDPQQWLLLSLEALEAVEADRFRRAKPGLVALGRVKAMEGVLNELGPGRDNRTPAVNWAAGDAAALRAVEHRLAGQGLTPEHVLARALEHSLEPVARLDSLQHAATHRQMRFHVLRQEREWQKGQRNALPELLPARRGSLPAPLECDAEALAPAPLPDAGTPGRRRSHDSRRRPDDPTCSGEGAIRLPHATACSRAGREHQDPGQEFHPPTAAARWRAGGAQAA